LRQKPLILVAVRFGTLQRPNAHQRHGMTYRRRLHA